MLAVEQRAGVASAPQASWQWLMQQMKDKNTDYEQFVLDLFQQSQA
jgi:hypothetical protein